MGHSAQPRPRWATVPISAPEERSGPGGNDARIGHIVLPGGPEGTLTIRGQGPGEDGGPEGSTSEVGSPEKPRRERGGPPAVRKAAYPGAPVGVGQDEGSEQGSEAGLISEQSTQPGHTHP